MALILLCLTRDSFQLVIGICFGLISFTNGLLCRKMFLAAGGDKFADSFLQGFMSVFTFGIK